MMKKSLLVAMVMVFLGILGTITGAVLADSSPWLSCPAGYTTAASWGGGSNDYLDKVPATRNSVALNFSLADTSNVVLDVWSGVGHPELGCQAGDNNDGGMYPGYCDDSTQVNESFYVIFNGSTLATVNDHGTDQWMEYGDVSLGQLGAGSYSVTLQHVMLGTETYDSVFYDVELCTQVVPSGWDKSSLQFVGSTTVSNGIVSATICNYGETMMGTTTWELWQADKGNPKNGAVIASGTVNALASGECQVLEYNVGGLGGNFKFEAYQRPGHPGTGVLWSD